jgi:hypothetical protein
LCHLASPGSSELPAIHFPSDDHGRERPVALAAPTGVRPLK